METFLATLAVFGAVVLEKPQKTGILRAKQHLLLAGQVREDVDEHVTQRHTCEEVQPATLRCVQEPQSMTEEMHQRDQARTGERRSVDGDPFRHDESGGVAGGAPRATNSRHAPDLKDI